jgi:uncharacterized SAM-binding protein YcdF (DUF218 family)
VVDIFFSWPMPLVWTMGLSLPFLRRPAGRRVIALCIVLFVVSSLPVIGRIVYAPLSAGAARHAETVTDNGAVAVIVPTAGSFVDAEGEWWPQGGTIRRFVAGRSVAQRLGLPLYVVGGSPFDNQPPEAETLAASLSPDPATVRVIPRGANSAQTAEALAVLPELAGAAVILVTDRYHIARMRAALRHRGLRVVASLVPTSPGYVETPAELSWRDFVPSDSGLDATSAAFREYVGIAWCLVSGGILRENL